MSLTSSPAPHLAHHLQPPALTEAAFTAAINNVENRLEQRLTAMGEHINGHTSTQVQAASTTIIANTTAVQQRIHRLSTAFKEVSARIVGLTSAIDTNLENFIMPASDTTTPMRMSPPSSPAPQLPPSPLPLMISRPSRPSPLRASLVASAHLPNPMANLFAVIRLCLISSLCNK
ncbi:hypothetical protein M758_UG022800, partial [Ceratodon purpureus]